MIEVKPECLFSFSHLINGSEEFIKRSNAVAEENPTVSVLVDRMIDNAYVSMGKITDNKKIIDLAVAISKVSCYSIYHLLRMQIEANDLETNSQ